MSARNSVEFGRYTIVRRLGGGGTSTVFEARDGEDRTVAIKLFEVTNSRLAARIDQGDLALARRLESRFESEIAILESIRHRNVIDLMDRGTSSSGARCFVMPFVARSLMHELWDRPDPPRGRAHGLDHQRAVDVLRQLLQGLAEVHRRGFVHRDIKPSNLPIDDGGTVKNADFGIATPAGEDLIPRDREFGRRAFMSPEQCRDPSQSNPRADVYSAALLAYRMLAGRLPKSTATAEVSGAGPALGDWIIQGMAADPDARPADAAAALTLLDQAVAADKS
jgi:serine/threonine-protein kinase